MIWNTVKGHKYETQIPDPKLTEIKSPYNQGWAGALE